MWGVFTPRDQGRGGRGRQPLHLRLSTLPLPPAKWKTPFDPKHTIESTFHVSKNKTVKVPMMGIKNLTVPYFRDEELACTVVELPYTSNDSALFILPDDGRMAAVEAQLLPETLRRWRDSLHHR